MWLVGDNAENSTDSRTYGPVPYGLVQGRVCFKVTISYHNICTIFLVASICSLNFAVFQGK